MNDRMAKQKSNVILMVDCSTSMRGKRIEQVNSAIKDIGEYLLNLQYDNSNVDFYVTIITFSTDARFLNNEKEAKIDLFKYTPLKAGGWTNLHLAYGKLAEIMKKESAGGIMPDFGGTVPIILLLTDGHPTGNDYKENLLKLKELPWFNVSLKYGIAIELQDKKTMDVLKEFIVDNGEIIQVYNANLLKQIIQIIVLTASKVKSQTSQIRVTSSIKRSASSGIKKAVSQALAEVDDWEW